MKEQQGYIALFRQFLSWEWFTDIKTCHLFIYCLLRANYKNGIWQNIPYKRGQFITSRRKLSVETGLTEQEIRTCLNRLKSTNEITNVSNRQNTIITVNNYEKYQNELLKNNKINQRNNQQSTSRITTDNTINNSTINTSINNSLSTKNERPKISKQEREILKSYSKKQGAKNINAYIRKLIDNGDYLNILEEEQKKAAKRKAEQALIEAQKATEIQEPELTEEERQKVLERAREIAGIDKKRRGKKQ